jgi:hypothetical protein
LHFPCLLDTTPLQSAAIEISVAIESLPPEGTGHISSQHPKFSRPRKPGRSGTEFVNVEIAGQPVRNSDCFLDTAPLKSVVVSLALLTVFAGFHIDMKSRCPDRNPNKMRSRKGLEDVKTVSNLRHRLEPICGRLHSGKKMSLDYIHSAHDSKGYGTSGYRKSGK